jgi:threonine dehydratase
LTRRPRVSEEIYERSLEARLVVSSHARKTPIDYSSTFSRLSGSRVYLKYENLQRTGSFKVRGAIYKVSKLARTVRGVVTASAGNHAQGVSYAASVYGLKAVIVMPSTASISKIEATRGYGAEVVLHGSNYNEAESRALEIAREKGYEFIHPFDDLDVIAGQGTIGFEILEDVPDVEAVVVPIGGGGLISGIASVVKRHRPGIKVVGVEPENAPKFAASIREGRIVEVDVKPTIADGLAVKRPGKLAFEVVSELVDDVVTVSEEEIAEAMYLLLERGKVLAEGAGAASLAAVLSGKTGLRGGKLVALVSGGNVDLTAIYRLLLRGLARAGRIASIRGYVPDVPGTLSRISGAVASMGGNIVEVIHERTDMRAPAWHTAIRLVIEVPSKERVREILEALRGMGYSFELED